MNKRMKSIDNSIKIIIILIINQLKSKKNFNDTYESPIFTEEEFLNSHQYILEDKIKSNKMYHRACLNQLQYFKDAFDFKQLQKDLFQLNSVQFYQRLVNIEFNSNEESFIIKTTEDKSTQKVIKELFENAQKRVYEFQKSDELVDISLKQSYLAQNLGQNIDKIVNRKSDNIPQVNGSDLNLNVNNNNNNINQNENSLGILSQLKQQNSQDENSFIMKLPSDNLVSGNDINKESQILSNEIDTRNRQSSGQNSLSNNKYNDNIDKIIQESQETSMSNICFDGKLDQNDFLVQQSTQKISISSVQEIQRKEDNNNKNNIIKDTEEEEEKKQDMSNEQYKIQSQNNMNLMKESQNTMNKEEQLIQKMNFMMNILENDPSSIFLDENKPVNNQQDYVIIFNLYMEFLYHFYIFGITKGKNLNNFCKKSRDYFEYKFILLKQQMIFDDDLDEKNLINYKTKYKIKLNLDIDPKFKCLNIILNQINEKYKDQLPINGDRFLIWIHTNDKSRVSSIQEYIQNTYLKNDPNNKLSLMRRCRQFLKEQMNRRLKCLQDITKKKDTILTDKKESETLLIESLFRELNHLFQIIEAEQLELNKNNSNPNQLFNNSFSNQIKYNSNRSSLNESIVRKSNKALNQDQDFNESKMFDIEDQDRIKLSQNQQFFVEQDIQKQNNQMPNQRKSNERQIVQEDNNDILNIRKRKIQIDEKLSKKFKLIDVNSMNLNIIDDLDQTGNAQFLSKQIMPNFEFIVNSINKSSIRQNFLRTYRPNFIILFEPNLNIIREVSVFQHLIQANGVNPIYELRTIMFNNSAESEKTLYNIVQENKSTERLVKEKNQMANSVDDPALRIKNITKKVNTRIGGQGISQQPTIIIDKREFRSDLPTILFHEGFKIVPIQLTTGDYILTKDIVIERKSVETPDLVNSIRNGRLYQQLAAMSKVYKKCYLLIEYSESMSFNLESINYHYDNIQFNQQDQNEKGKKPQSNTITFYLPLIVSQFDNVKILWSKGPLHTSKIFQMLKQNQGEPIISDYLKEQEKKDTKEIQINEFIEENQDVDKYKSKQDTLFQQIKTTDEEN